MPSPARRGGASASSSERGVGAGSAISASPRSAAWPGCRRARRRGSRAPGAAVASSTTRGPRGTGDRLRQCCRTPRRSARGGHVPGPRPTSLGLPRLSQAPAAGAPRPAQIAVRESDRSESGESERRVVAEPDSPGELERAPVRIHRGRVFPASLGRPRFEQQHRGAKRVVSDRVRVTAGDRGRRGDGRDVAGVRRTDRANEAARCDAPVVSAASNAAAASSAIVAARSTSPDCPRASASISCAKPRCHGAAIAASETARSPAASAGSRSNSSVAM
jgi:hypothetical protein